MRGHRRHKRDGLSKIDLQQVLHARHDGCFVALIIDPNDDKVLFEIDLMKMVAGDVVELKIGWKGIE
jgi:hypothetical protein